MKLAAIRYFYFSITFVLLADAHVWASASDCYKQADSVAAVYEGHSLMNLKDLADKLTTPLCSDHDKFRAIYRWVCENVENDYEMSLIHKIKSEKLRGDELVAWNKKFRERVFRKLIRERKTVCTGYAWLIKELARHAGLTCEVVDGYGRTGKTNVGGKGVLNHSWNAVRLDGAWYLCDATWSSGFVDPRLSMFIKNFNEGYFLTPPQLFLLNHYPADTRWKLTDQKLTLKEFLNAPLPYRSAFNQKVIPVYPATYNVTTRKGEAIHVSYHIIGDEPVNEVSLQTSRSGNLKTVDVSFTKDDENVYKTDYAFNNKGSYDVYVLVNGSYVFTYHVTVD